MMKFSKKIEEVLEKFDFSLCGEITERCDEKGKYDVELETCSPEGEDVIVSLIYDGTEKDFIRAFIEYANSFNDEEHAAMWIENRGKNGVPESINDLLIDARWIKNILLRVVEALESSKEEYTENNVINFTQEELQLLYTACMSYGDKLSQILKSIPNEEEIVLNKLSDRVKDSWNLARKITEYMEE